MIGKIIAKARKDADLTKTELSKITDINIGHLTHIEKGERNPSHKTLKSICKALNIPYMPLMFTYDKDLSEEQETYKAENYISCNKILAFNDISGFIDCPVFFPTAAFAVKVNDNSMEPTLNVGDVIVSKRIRDEEKANLKVGDIITFLAPEGFSSNPLIEGKKVTHRIIVAPYEEDGVWYVWTQGDRAGMPDEIPIPIENVKAKYVRTSAFLTGLIGFLRTWYGFLILIAVPLLGILIYEIILLTKTKKSEEKKKIEEEEKIRIEKERQEKEEEIAKKAVEEYIKSVEEKKKNENIAKGQEGEEK